MLHLSSPASRTTHSDYLSLRNCQRYSEWIFFERNWIWGYISNFLKTPFLAPVCGYLSFCGIHKIKQCFATNLTSLFS